MPEPDTIMVQFRLPPGPETLVAAAQRLGVPPSALDGDYGVIATDPADRLFTVLLRSDFATAVAARLDNGDPAEGLFSNPGIAPFGS